MGDYPLAGKETADIAREVPGTEGVKNLAEAMCGDTASALILGPYQGRPQPHGFQPHGCQPQPRSPWKPP
jgi:hypothetical protein